VSPEALAAARVSLSGLQLTADAVWWSESRPSDGGRQAVLRAGIDLDGRAGRGARLAPPEEVGPGAMSVRSRVHEYGGGAWVGDPAHHALFVVDGVDQGVWGLEPDRPARLLSGVAPEGEAWRHGDLRWVSGGDWVVAVRERHRPAGVDDEGVDEEGLDDEVVDDEVVAVPRHGAGPATVLLAGRDFYAAPRPSPDGARLAWLAWDHPDMPWDGCELWVGDLRAGTPGPSGPRIEVTRSRCIAGGRSESVGQPTWGEDGTLWFVSDRRGWWQPYRWRPESGPPVAPECDVDAEFHAPDWPLGQSTLVPLGDGSLLARMRRGGRDRLVWIDPVSRVPTEVDQPCVTIAAVAAVPLGAPAPSSGRGRLLVALLGATETETAGVHVLELAATGQTRAPVVTGQLRHLPAGAPVLPADLVSRARPLSFPTVGGVEAHLLFYAPVVPAGERTPASPPPLLVLCHGGPTGAVEPGLDLSVQFWTTRGIAVAAVDYRGSSGYGRSFRTLLDGAWGVADAEDVAAAARFLADAGLVDGRRLAVRGASAGGLTALRAATRGGPFSAAVLAYGVTDLEALARDTHKFESHYTDRLVGPWPQCADRYHERSPARHPEDVGAAVLLLQGEDDAVVPPNQAARMADALRAGGMRCDVLLFPGEGHGFRRAETVAAAARTELAFLGEVLGFEPAADDP
jgi:dipeptidyl aminopeptidase/acylaminoacyl peptidase